MKETAADALNECLREMEEAAKSIAVNGLEDGVKDWLSSLAIKNFEEGMAIWKANEQAVLEAARSIGRIAASLAVLTGRETKVTAMHVGDAVRLVARYCELAVALGKGQLCPKL